MAPALSAGLCASCAWAAAPAAAQAPLARRPPSVRRQSVCDYGPPSRMTYSVSTNTRPELAQRVRLVSKSPAPAGRPSGSSSSSSSTTTTTTAHVQPPAQKSASARDLDALAADLAETCARNGWPHPAASLPSRPALRRVNPTLANRIEALRGRDGYRRLARHVGAEPLPPPIPRSPRRRRDERWHDVDYLRAVLRPHQHHPNVLPRMSSLSPELRTAVRIHGGSRAVAAKLKLLCDNEWRGVRRFGDMLDGLVMLVYSDRTAFVGDDGGRVIVAAAAVSRALPRTPPPQSPSPPLPQQLAPLFDRAESESLAQIPFPRSAELRRNGLYGSVQWYGGRRALSTRLGFARDASGLFMGPFSVSFAAALVGYAAAAGVVAHDGCVGMPSYAQMEADGRADLVALCERFGGAVDVGRRVGLVPFVSPRGAVGGGGGARSKDGSFASAGASAGTGPARIAGDDLALVG